MSGCRGDCGFRGRDLWDEANAPRFPPVSDATGYESWVGRAIDVPYGWVGLPWEVDPRTCSDSAFRPIVPGTYAVNRVESIGGQPWAYLVAGSQRYKVDAADTLGPPEKPPPDPATAAEPRVGFNVVIDSGPPGLPWDTDPAAARDEDWAMLPRGIYWVERIETVGDARWVWVKAGYYSDGQLPNVKFRAAPGTFE